MDSDKLISSFSALSTFQKSALAKGNIQTVTDLLLNSTQEIARNCRISLLEVKNILNTVLKDECKSGLRRLDDIKDEGDEKITTGDAVLDDALGGGIRTGMIWEIVGESAAGKTQFALQLSLCVQIPPHLGGLSASACILTTSSTLPTSRLLQISQEHELLSSTICGLEDVHTIYTPTIGTVLQVLSTILPAFIIKKGSSSSEKPIKLIVIDALAELFHSATKTTMSTLVERSQQISELSLLMHKLASSHQVAILVLNEVVDVFDRPTNVNVHRPRDLIYSKQSQWFNTGNSVPGENKKEASLGLTWANQVNTRILLSRTGRRQHIDLDPKYSRKRRRLDGPAFKEDSGYGISDIDQEPVLLRRLNIIFSSVSNPTSLDYIISERGISVLSPNENPSSTKTVPVVQPSIDAPELSVILDTPGAFSTWETTSHGTEYPLVEDATDLALNNIVGAAEEEEKFWDDESYSDIDWEAFETSLTQAPA